MKRVEPQVLVLLSIVGEDRFGLVDEGLDVTPFSVGSSLGDGTDPGPESGAGNVPGDLSTLAPLYQDLKGVVRKADHLLDDAEGSDLE